MSEIDTMTNTLDALNENQGLKAIMDISEQIMEIPEGSLTDENIKLIFNMVNSALTPTVEQQSIKAIITTFEQEGYSREQAIATIKLIKEQLNNFIEELKPSEKKKMILTNIFNSIYNIYEKAVDKYHNYNIVLPIQLEEGAKAPTYAHSGDVAADLYAMKDVTIPAHSISNLINTGVHIALPEGWMAIIVPRSSIGMKTGLRLSNSQGIIDSGYRGALGVIYDNISDSDYEIKQGDRIAQMYILPIYHFKPQIVDTLSETDRGNGGFGSTGK